MLRFGERAGIIPVSEQLQHLLGVLENQPDIQCLNSIPHGIEKESLRIDKEGHIALTPHPAGLGSPLTHEFITTDFSEALVEFITPVFTDPSLSLEYLKNIHRFLYSRLENQELLWTSSMPCIIAADEQIPIAQYGSSNIGKLKTLYRLGLSHRYSRSMQTIAGIHYNFSLPDAFWSLLQKTYDSDQSLQAFKTEQYFNLIRNFRRYSWLLIYLFGASPAVCKSFIRSKDRHGLDAFDEHTYYMPYGTSLRMGDLGYTSDAQSELFISYNSLEEYINGMRKAVKTPYPPYAEFDKDADSPQQINSNVLQIENEFYSTIRPKRVSTNGERPIRSLKQGGVEYIEVRCLDLNPFLPVGIDENQIHFLNAFLLFCLLRKSPLSSEPEYREIQKNFIAVVNEGRKPGLGLKQNGQDIQLHDWAQEILDETASVAKMLDKSHSDTMYADAVQAQLAKIHDSELTPSAKVLAGMKEAGLPYFPFAMNQSRKAAETLGTGLPEETLADFNAITEESNSEREYLEQSDSMSFREFLFLANQI